MSASQTEPKTYSSPKVNKLTPEQAKIYLIGQAIHGDRGAKALLDVFFPTRTNTKEFPHASRGKGRGA
jgi:hypothetical protein